MAIEYKSATQLVCLLIWKCKNAMLANNVGQSAVSVATTNMHYSMQCNVTTGDLIRMKLEDSPFPIMSMEPSGDVLGNLVQKFTMEAIHIKGTSAVLTTNNY